MKMTKMFDSGKLPFRVNDDKVLRPSTWAALAAAALLVATTAVAAGNTDKSEARVRYEKDRAACMSGKSHQDRETCLKETVAALAAAERGNLPVADKNTYERNRLVRCNALPVPDREDCVRRMNGEGVVAGSVENGGIYRELVRTITPAKVN